MSPSVTPLALKRAECAFLELASPAARRVPIGVLLLDVAANELHIRMRRDWKVFAAEESEVLASLEDQLHTYAREIGAAQILDQFANQLSGIIRISAREQMVVGNFARRLRDLYEEHVQETVLPYETHLPRYAAQAAAGALSAEQLIATDPAGWVRVPSHLRVSTRMFALSIEGRSMEPRIPEGSICVFRSDVTGSRSGRLLLIQRHSSDDPHSRLTVKQYYSEKQIRDGSWEHTKIELRPLNPEFEPWLLEPEDFRVLGEFVTVLPEE